MTSTYKILTFLVLGTLVFEITKFFSFFQEYSSWQYADWLINYQGGFVRRGLIGEILFRIHDVLNIDLDFLILFFVIFLYLLLAYYLIKCIKYIESSPVNILIFLSPGFFLYPIMNSGIIGRKDTLLIAMMGCFVFLENKINQKYHLVILILTIMVMSLSHSAFIFYMPYFIFLYILVKNKNGLNFKFYESIIIVFIFTFLFLFIKFFNGSDIQIQKICESVKEFASENCGKSDQIFWLGNPVEVYLAEKSEMGNNFLRNYFIVYIFSAFFVYLFLSIKLFNSKFNENILQIKKFNPFIIIFALFFLSIPVYVFGRDWGRYIYISYSLSFFIYVFCLKNNILDFNDSKILNYFKLRKLFFLIFIFFYSFFWTFPFYDANSFKLVLKKPILTIIKNLKI